MLPCLICIGEAQAEGRGPFLESRQAAEKLQYWLRRNVATLDLRLVTTQLNLA